MRLKSILLASAGALALISAAPANADGLYVSVLGGGNFSEDETGTFTTQGGLSLGAFAGKHAVAHFEVESGFMLGGALGFGLDNWLHGLSLEIEPSYRRNNVGGAWEVAAPAVLVDSVAPVALTSGQISANLSTFALMANLWYEFDIGMRVKPFIGGGVGWARSHLDGFFEDRRLRLAAVDPFEDGFDAENNGFAYQVGFGLAMYLMPGTKLSLGYRYLNAPNITLDFQNVSNTSEPSALDIGDGHVKFDNNSHTVALSLGIAID